MKLMIALLATASTFFVAQANAADTKLGNVIAVERTIDNVYANCVDQIQKGEGHKPAERYHICKLEVGTTTSDTIPGGQRVLTVRSRECTIDSEVKNSSILLTVYGNEAKANFASAKACLKTALNASNDTLQFLIYTIE